MWFETENGKDWRMSVEMDGRGEGGENSDGLCASK